MLEPRPEDLADYITDPSVLSQEMRTAIEQREADDADFAARLQIIRTLAQATVEGDTRTLAHYANMAGVPLDDFMPDPYDILAMETFHVLRGAVSKQEAETYALYRKETDQSGAHETQWSRLDPDALQALVRAGVCPDIQRAGATLLKVLTALVEVRRDEEATEQ